MGLIQLPKLNTSFLIIMLVFVGIFVMVLLVFGFYWFTLCSKRWWFHLLHRQFQCPLQCSCSHCHYLTLELHHHFQMGSWEEQLYLYWGCLFTVGPHKDLTDLILIQPFLHLLPLRVSLIRVSVFSKTFERFVKLSN